MVATAFSNEGVTATGTWSKPGTVAADPALLPLGSKIRVTDAGDYSGEYTVEDTGTAVKGAHIDIYMKSNAEAKQFGKRQRQGCSARTWQVAVLNSGSRDFLRRRRVRFTLKG